MADIDRLVARVEDHLAEDARRFESIENGFALVAKDIKDIKENHLAHIEPDLRMIKWIFLTVGATVIVWLVNSGLHAWFPTI